MSKFIQNIQTQTKISFVLIILGLATLVLKPAVQECSFWELSCKATGQL
jgi:hypothetical protein